jgi:hypothetical protein
MCPLDRGKGQMSCGRTRVYLLTQGTDRHTSQSDKFVAQFIIDLCSIIIEASKPETWHRTFGNPSSPHFDALSSKKHKRKKKKNLELFARSPSATL